MNEIGQNSCLIEQAARWVVRLSADEVSAEQRKEFESWLAEDLRHQKVFEQAKNLWQFLLPPVKTLPVSHPRRRMNNQARTLLAILLFLTATYFFLNT